MRIAIVLQPWDRIELPFEQGSSIAIIGHGLAKELAARHDVVIFCGGGTGAGETAHAGQLTVHKLPTPREKLFKLADRITGIFEMSPPLMTRQGYFKAYFDALAEALARDRFDVVHVFTLFQYLPRLREAAPTAALILHMEGETASLAPEGTLAPALQSVDLFIGCSGFIVERLVARRPSLAQRSAVLWNGVDIPEGASGPPRSRDPYRLLFVGRLSPEKGVHVLLQSFGDLATERSDIELDLVGGAGLLPYAFHVGISADPADRALRPFYGKGLLDKFRRQVLANRSAYLADLKRLIPPAIEGRVHFLGARDHRALGALYARATLFVFPSAWHEPFGIPVVEAMAAGVPVVSTHSGGIPEIVQHGQSGVLVPRGDADALAKAIGRLLDDPDYRERLASAGYERARKQFAWPVLAQQLEALYERAVHARTGDIRAAG